MRRNETLYRMIVTAALLALGYLLPFLTGQNQALGKMLCLMHIPALICGLTCGWAWGAALGFLLPVTRMFFFGAPPAVNAWPMAFELFAYGLATGLLYPLLTRLMKGRRLPAMLAALVCAMVLGRLLGGAAKALLLAGGLLTAKAPFTLAVFWADYFAATLPGVAVHLIVVPAVVAALERARLSPVGRKLSA